MAEFSKLKQEIKCLKDQQQTSHPFMSNVSVQTSWMEKEGELAEVQAENEQLEKTIAMLQMEVEEYSCKLEEECLMREEM